MSSSRERGSGASGTQARNASNIGEQDVVLNLNLGSIQIVEWNWPEDPENPLNWPYRKKWITTAAVASFTFISSSSSSMLTPAIPKILQDIGPTGNIEQQLIFSAFIIAYLVGPMVLAPLSETFGRSIILHTAAWFYFVWSLCSGFARTPGQMIAFRLLAGLGASAPIAIGGGVLGDVWAADKRGRAMGIYSIMPMIGLSFGPCVGALIVQFSNWRWIFWGKSIFDAAIQIVVLFLLNETYAPVIIRRKVTKQQYGELYGREPIVQIFSLYLAFLFGTQYLMLSTFATLWTNQYKQSVVVAGLHYISLGLGFIIGGQCCAFLGDKVYTRMKRRDNSEGRPEHRIPMMVPGALLVPIGLFWYGWSARVHLHWIMSDIGAFIFATGTSFGVQTTQLYLVDTYSRYAASALAATNVLRFTAGFTFPLFAPSLFQGLGYGWGNTLLGFSAMGIGILGPLLLWNYRRLLQSRI